MNNVFEIPAIARDTKPEGRSARYGFVGTAPILKNLMNHGWEVSKVHVSRPRKNDPSTAKHLITLRHPYYDNTLGEGLRPTINILNSHDASSRLIIGMGIYRLVCANGLMVGQDWGRISVIHRDSLVKDVEQGVDQLIRHLPAVAASIKQMQGVTLDEARRRELWQRVLSLRVNDTALQHFPNPKPVRYQDAGHDLFTVFNVAQERLIGGGLSWEERDTDGRLVTRHLRRVKAPGELMRLNTEAMKLALEYAA
jgi:hypothetical protein